jgi:hypothetical protein
MNKTASREESDTSARIKIIVFFLLNQIGTLFAPNLAYYKTSLYGLNNRISIDPCTPVNVPCKVQ